MLTFNLLTLFPEFFDSPLAASLMGRARRNGLVKFRLINPRKFSLDRHRHVDDRPYGGGPGMVMRLEPLDAALNSIADPGRILLTSPAGRQLTQSLARDLASLNEITIICGRYEGVDARLADLFPLEEISVCQAVLNGGETAALAIIEAVCRFLPGFLGKEESASEESFSNGLLEYPHYTRPATYRRIQVPVIPLSGNHAAIASWRRREALARTLQKRPDLLAEAPLSPEDATMLRDAPLPRSGRNLAFCLCHYPVRLEDERVGVSSLTNLDVHDIARISRGYGMMNFFILTPLADQRRLLADLLRHWLNGSGARVNPDRAQALQLARPVADFEELERTALEAYGTTPTYVATSALWPEKGEPAPLGFAEIRQELSHAPVIILLGTARGLEMGGLPLNCARMRPLRFLGYNHLSVRSAAAILADRILGDFF